MRQPPPEAAVDSLVGSGQPSRLCLPLLIAFPSGFSGFCRIGSRLDAPPSNLWDVTSHTLLPRHLPLAPCTAACDQEGPRPGDTRRPLSAFGWVKATGPDHGASRGTEGGQSGTIKQDVRWEGTAATRRDLEEKLSLK